jgi:D-sedoheptulose 7-phosphate isomerase
MGVVSAVLSGKGGGRMMGYAQPLIVVPSTVTARFQETHIMLGKCCAMPSRSK